MRTSLNEIRETEKYLRDELHPQDRLVFEARLITEPNLRINTFLQRRVYTLIRLYHRKKLKNSIESMHERLFEDPAEKNFAEQIRHTFKSTT